MSPPSFASSSSSSSAAAVVASEAMLPSESSYMSGGESASVVAGNLQNAGSCCFGVSLPRRKLISLNNGGGGFGEVEDTSMCLCEDEASPVVEENSDEDRSGMTLREHDYIGLSEVSSSSSPPPPLPPACFRTILRSPSRRKDNKKVVREELNLNLGATELRLGPRPNLESGRCGDKQEEAVTCFRRSGSTSEIEACGGLDEAQASLRREGTTGSVESQQMAFLPSRGPSTEKPTASVDRARTGSFRSFPNTVKRNGELEREQGCGENLKLGISLVVPNRGNRSEELADKKMFHGSGGSPMEDDKQSQSNQQGNQRPQHLQEALQENRYAHASQLGGETGENGHYWVGGPKQHQHQHQQQHHMPHSCRCSSHEAVEGSRGMNAAPSHTSSVAAGARSAFPCNGTEMLSQKPKQPGAQHPSPIYSCNTKPLPSSSSSWQQTREQSGGLFRGFRPQQQLATRGPALMSKRATEASVEANRKIRDSSFSSPPENLEEETVASSEITKHPSPDMQPAAPVKEATPTTAAPPRQSLVVGWPPVRNFRKNTLAFQQQPPRPAQPSQKRQSRSTTTTPPVSTSVGTTPTAPANSGAPSQTSFLVKVYMDGLPIGRKVDLTTHNSYDKLKSALEDMFQQFIGQPGGGPQSFTGGDSGVSSSYCCRKLNFLQNSDYVLTYEDRESDLMLVGDVPWEMFTTNVRRLRIMKGVDIAQGGGDNTMSSQLEVM